MSRALLAWRRVLAGVAALAALTLGRAALADEPAADRGAEARAHFERGNALFKEGAWAAALAELLESRRLRPTRNATRNAAVCLRQLARPADALDLYEALLRDFPDAPTELKDEAQRAVVELRTRVGTVEIGGAEAGAAVSIDGEDRGEYPPIAPLRTAVGSHTVRLYKEGFEPFETRLEVAGGQTAHVEAKLRALVASGQLEINEQGGRALDVIMDGNLVGKTPWSGRAPLGDHVIVLRGPGDLGAPPVSTTAERGRTTVLTLAAEELASGLRIEPLPANAGVAIDRVNVGRGIWEGRLRAGAHTIEVAAPGFLTSASEASLQRGERRVARVELARDPRSIFAAGRARFTVELGAAAVLAPLFGGDLAGGCTGFCSETPGLGGQAAVRGGYVLSSGLGFGLTAGYLGANQAIAARATTVTPVKRLGESVAADDSTWIRAARVGAWGGFTFGARVPIQLRVEGGALLGSVVDARRASGVKGTVEPTWERHPLRGAYVVPEIRVGVALSERVTISAGVELLLAFLPSPPRWFDAHLVVVDRPPGSLLHRDEGTYPKESVVGPIVAIAPGLGARYAF